ncbi:hypothetical protein PFISCL1PPCAC_3004, partial [Pristionchus fissidentatus]
RLNATVSKKMVQAEKMVAKELRKCEWLHVEVEGANSVSLKLEAASELDDGVSVASVESDEEPRRVTVLDLSQLSFRDALTELRLMKHYVSIDFMDIGEMCALNEHHLATLLEASGQIVCTPGAEFFLTDRRQVGLRETSHEEISGN